MKKIKDNLARFLGVIGSLLCLGIFIHDPSFPTPDKIIIFLVFVFMIFGQAIVMLGRLGPFVLLMLVYESFRSVVPSLNNHVNYLFAPHFDKLIFGKLPTLSLQNWLWRGHTSWYDVVFYIPYMLFFAVPIGLAILVWKTRDEHYWQVVTAYLTLFFAAFLTFLVFPAAPPWLASQGHYIEPVARVSTSVWFSLGVHNFPSLYNHIAPNPVAAIPSLHAGGSILLSIFVFKLYGRRWGLLSLIYPFLVCVGVVYEGEHYFFDVMAGSAYALGSYAAAPYVLRFLQRQAAFAWANIKKLDERQPLPNFLTAYSSSTKNVLELDQ